jgi:hypothetical protein
VLAQLRNTVPTAVLLSIPSTLTPRILRQAPPRKRASVQAAIDLIAAEDRGELSLADIAGRAGVTGRFSKIYHERFGEHPSATLRRLGAPPGASARASARALHLQRRWK